MFRGEAKVEIKAKKKERRIANTYHRKHKSQPILGCNWLGKLEIGLQGNKSTNSIRKLNTDESREKIVRQGLVKLIAKGHLEKADKTTENCFISSVVIAIK